VLEVEVGCAAARDLVEVEEAGAVRSMWVFLRKVEGEEGAGRRTGVEGIWISWSPEPRPLTVRKEKKKDGEDGLGSERIGIKERLSLSVQWGPPMCVHELQRVARRSWTMGTV
jgi:hypothetical protein